MSEEQAKQEASPAADDALLPAGLRDQLLSLLADRINAGDTLITEAHFQKALPWRCRETSTCHLL